jgi:hypothetical protein
MGSHQSAAAKSVVWLTPPAIIDALGPFDLDPCARPLPRPWSTAASHIVEPYGLIRSWYGRVWLNPPFGPLPLLNGFMAMMASHNHGTALLAARTETAIWFNWVWRHAAAVLFLQGRPHFHYQDGSRAKANSGCPIALIAYGREDAELLENCGLSGFFVHLRRDAPLFAQAEGER